MTFSGPGDDNSRSEWEDLAPEAGAPLTFQFDERQKSFLPTQQDLLQTYFNEQILANFQEFVKAAPEALKPLRQLIVAYAPKMSCDSFEQFINVYYPEVLQNDKTHEQNVFFRGLLIRFNRLCNKQIEIDHPLYQTIFDPRISPTKSSSPTKQNLVASFFAKKIQEHFACPATDQFVANALAWINDQTPRFNQPVAAAGGTARRQLTFHY